MQFRVDYKAVCQSDSVVSSCPTIHYIVRLLSDRFSLLPEIEVKLADWMVRLNDMMEGVLCPLTSCS